jgi:hypothetical protein
MKIDIRGDSTAIVRIVFAEKDDPQGMCLGYVLSKNEPGFSIKDRYEDIYIYDLEHAENLKTAIDKAIELGWVK